MTDDSYHKLTIYLETPKVVIVDKPFKSKYRVVNSSDRKYPGGDIQFTLYWVSLSGKMWVPHILKVPELEPESEYVQEFEVVSLIDDMIAIMKKDEVSKAKDGITVEVYNSYKRRIYGGDLIHSLRVKSHEELSQFTANKWAVIGIFLLVLFQLIEWYLTYCYNR